MQIRHFGLTFPEMSQKCSIIIIVVVIVVVVVVVVAAGVAVAIE